MENNEILNLQRLAVKFFNSNLNGTAPGPSSSVNVTNASLDTNITNTNLDVTEINSADILANIISLLAVSNYHTGVIEGTITSTGTPVQITTTVGSGYIIFKALTANTGIVKVGATNTPPHELSSGESMTIESADITDFYMSAIVSGEGVSYTIKYN